MQHRPPQPPQYSLSAYGLALQQHQQQRSPQSTVVVERDIERDRLREQAQQEMLAQQRYEQATDILQQQREQQQREQQQSPRENHIGTIPIQQPIASRVPATLHGPNGILNDQHPGVGGPQPQPAAPLGAPSGPGNIFSNGVQATNENSLRPFTQQGASALPPQGLLGFSNAVTPQQLPNGVAALAQGQQPILNVRTFSPFERRL